MFYANGSIKEGFIDEELVFQGILLDKGKCFFYKNGNFQECNTSIKTRLFNYSLIGRVKFYESGKVEKISVNEKVFKINNIDFISEYPRESYDIIFYESGNLMAGTIYKSLKNSNFKFKPKTKIYFYETGEIKSGFLDKKIQINDITFVSGCDGYSDFDIELFINGKVKGGCIVEKKIIEGIEFEEKKFVYF